MKRKLLVLAVAALLALVLAVPASASKPIKVSGVIVADWETFKDKTVPVGNRCFVDFWADNAYSGDIVASCAHHGWQVAHGPCAGSFPGSYKETLHLEADCTTTGSGLLGKQGTFRLRCNGELLPAADPPQLMVMDWRQDCVILAGTGDLANLRGSLTLESHYRSLEDAATGLMTYSGEIHFDPDK